MVNINENDQYDLSDEVEKQILKNSETMKSIKELRKNMDNMKARADEICVNYGMTPDQFSIYIENPSNFSEEEWRLIENHRIKLNSWAEKLRSIAEKANLNTFKKVNISEEEKREAVDIPKKKRSPFLKKGWLKS